MLNEEALSLFWYWILEREAIRLRREEGLPRPWTENAILANNHFCNVRREDDRGTKEIRKVVLEAGIAVTELPWVYTAARMFNKADTLHALLHGGWAAVKWNRDEEGKKIFHTAYVVSTCGRSMDKVDYVREVVGGVRDMGKSNYLTCESMFKKLLHVNGLGTFLAGQVVADLKNDRYLQYAEDWFTWSAIGPGSRKGLTYIFGKFPDSKYQDLMLRLYHEMPPNIRGMHIHAQDLQNCLCEFSKYMAILEGTRGRSRPY